MTRKMLVKMLVNKYIEEDNAFENNDDDMTDNGPDGR